MSLNSALDALFILDLGRRRRAELVHSTSQILRYEQDW